jgi:S-adenosylmethionine hydrolase
VLCDGICELYSILRNQFLAIGEWMRSIITLTTDFGVSSPYVAQMKGVILSICRDVELIELTHGIAAQNIREGAVVLADVTPRFPAGSIHVAVVDPGVGTARRIVYAEIGEQRYIAPDNGLLSLLAAREAPRTTIAIDNAEFWLPNHSQTFHGRDIMAPVAAHLAGGVKPERLGQAARSLVALDWPEPTISSHGVAGEILYIDSFGNLVSNISREDITRIGEPAALVVDCGGQRIRGIVSTYGAALEGEIIALFDSQERLEVAKVNGNAARELQIGVGERLSVLTE